MLAKKNRADKKAIEKVYKNGRFLNSLHLSFKFNKDPSSTLARISFTVPKTVSKLAVKRNYLRRQGYNALEKFLPIIPKQVVGIFVFKKYPKEISEIENEVKEILNKIN